MNKLKLICYRIFSPVILWNRYQQKALRKQNEETKQLIWETKCPVQLFEPIFTTYNNVYILLTSDPAAHKLINE